jgi:hypothetical protein
LSDGTVGPRGHGAKARLCPPNEGTAGPNCAAGTEPCGGTATNIRVSHKPTAFFVLNKLWKRAPAGLPTAAGLFIVAAMRYLIIDSRGHRPEPKPFAMTAAIMLVAKRLFAACEECHR